MRSQREVTLKDDLELRDRLDIYRNFLLYCLSGEVVALPMGSTVVVERDSSEFARLVRTLPPHAQAFLASCASEHRRWALLRRMLMARWLLSLPHNAAKNDIDFVALKRPSSFSMKRGHACLHPERI